MAAAFRSISYMPYVSRANTTLTAPTGIVNGDILLLAFLIGKGSAGTPSITLPAGFAYLQGPHQLIQGGFYVTRWLAYKIANAESGNYTVLHTTDSSNAVMVCVSGGDTNRAPVSTSWGELGPPGPPYIAMGLSLPAYSASMYMCMFDHGWDYYTSGGTPPTGMTERLDQTNSLWYVADEVFTGGETATGDRSHNGSASVPYASFMVGIAEPTTAPAGIGTRSISFNRYQNTGVINGTALLAPSRTTDNDILLLAFYTAKSGSAAAAPTFPAGWTQLQTGTVDYTGLYLTRYLLWKVAASEPAQSLVTHETAISTCFVMLCIVGGNRSVAPQSSDNSGTGTTSTALSLTATAANSLSVFIGQSWDTVACSPPTGYLERVDATSTLLYEAEKAVAAGATGDIVMTNANGVTPSGPWAAFHVLIEPGDSIRFFPRSTWESRMNGGIFEGSDSETTGYTTLFTIPSTPSAGWQLVSPSTLGTYRYLRYRGPNGANCNVAEIEFYRAGAKVTGTGFGSIRSYQDQGRTFNFALDGDIGTYYDAFNGSGDYVGIDTGGAGPPPDPVGRNKRASWLGIDGAYRVILPIPDSVISTSDRYQIAGKYYGVVVVAALKFRNRTGDRFRLSPSFPC